MSHLYVIWITDNFGTLCELILLTRDKIPNPMKLLEALGCGMDVLTESEENLSMEVAEMLDDYGAMDDDHDIIKDSMI